MVSPVESHNQDFMTRTLRQAASETGTDFNFLLRTAARESNFDVRAEATTSSATGLFQFIEQTWLGVMHRHGSDHGYGDAASAISRDAGGRYVVTDPVQRQRILDLRFDAEASARMAGELAAENAGQIEARIGRPVSSGELYAAHFLGAQGAASLIEAAETTPDARADRLFPAAAQANRAIFYENGQARSASEVLATLTRERPVPAVPAGQPDSAGGQVQLAGPASPVRNAVVTPGSHRVGNGELSPALVEILASLDAPRAAGRVRNS
ncbi:hypothetical protein [Maricaulis sp.]|uniref:hypothetical protein n=1 Tax=Maricaulis sp. TaxID=1486257 RepID=UPI002639BE94|nr:hypothetical protein [Maricaulis sp.]